MGLLSKTFWIYLDSILSSAYLSALEIQQMLLQAILISERNAQEIYIIGITSNIKTYDT